MRRENFDQLIAASSHYHKEKKFWLNQLSGELGISRFPPDFTNKVNSQRMETVTFEISSELFQRLIKVSSGSDIRLHMILVSGIVMLIDRFTRSRDILVGIPIYKQDIEGQFTNSVLVLRNSLPEAMTFKELLIQVRQTINQANENANFPIESLLYHLGLSASEYEFPLFDVAVLLKNIHDSSYLEHIHNNMTFTFNRVDECLEGYVTYNSLLYSASTVERILELCKNLLRDALFNVDKKISLVEILSAVEKKKILVDFNNNRVDFPLDRTIHQRIETHAAGSPHRTAVSFNASILNYQELNQRANQLANFLKKCGIRTNQTAGILMERSSLMLESILATWKAGGAYIPFEPDDPVERTLEILKDSGSPVLLTQREYLDPKIENSYQGRVIKLDKEIERIREERKSSPEVAVDMNNLAYVIYTSGSTGKPKGAMVEHIGMMNHIQAKIHDLQLAGDSTVAQNASHTFDISVWQFFAALTAGGKTVIYPYDLILESGRFISRIVEDQVTILEVVPSYLSIMLDAIAMQYPMSLPVKYLLVTGEEVKPHLVKRWFQMFPDIKMVNAYGPTEASDDITHYIMEKAPDRERIPIGNPLQNLNIYIVDEHMNPCPIGIKGEILVSGIGVGRGYLNDEERTKQVFGEDPFAKEKGVRLYRTGDLGCWLPDGTVEFRGRKDYQVKIRGFRIELGEIENHLLQFPAIKEAVVVDKEDSQADRYLCAYLVTDGKWSESEMQKQLAYRLPDYMIPAYFVQLETIPLTPNGKVNRKALPDPQKDNLPGIIYITEDMLTDVQLELENSIEEKKIVADGKVDENEKKKILYEFNNTGMDFPQEVTIQQLFEGQVEKTPDHAALVYENNRMTYSSLNEWANDLGRLLRVKGVKGNGVVGLMLERSLEMILGVLAVLKIGAAYLPIGSEYSLERNHYILEDCKPPLVLTDKQLPLPTTFKGIILDIQDLQNKAPLAANTAYHDHSQRPDDAAYIMYTSGSTGRPRGVLVQQNHLVNAALGWREEFNLVKMEVHLLQIANFTFDVSTGDIVKALLNGGRLIICPGNIIGNNAAFYSIIKKQRITLFESTPSLIIPFMEYVYKNQLDIDPLYLLILGSDICPKEEFKKLISRFGNRMRIVNSYGVTEATIDTSYYEESSETRFSYENLPIGKPLPNMKFYVLNTRKNLQPIGMVGELWIGGKSVTRGYLNQIELTRQRFVVVSISGVEERIYQTGDLARWLENGNMEFLGRMDHQVQIKGIRVEPGEIENILLNYPDIKEAAVVARKDLLYKHNRNDQNRDTYLWAFVTAKRRMQESQLREYLNKKLPIYMIPSCLLQLEKMPLTPNRKLNRKALEVINLEKETDPGYVAPRNEKEKLLAEIWSEILEVENVGINHNFFQLGGHSLKAVYIISRINKELLTSLPVSIIFKKPTIAELMESLTEKKDEKLFKIEKCPENEYYQLSHAQKRLWFFDQMDPGNPAYNLPQAVRFIGDLDIGALEQTIGVLVQRHETLRTSINVVEVEEKSDETRMEELPVQIVHDQVEIKLNRRDISNLPQKEREKILHQLIEEEGLKPFDMTQGPLLRITLVTLDTLEQVMIFVMHHIISDGWSMRVIVEEFGYFYDQLKRNSAINYQPLQFQYKDFAYWQNQLLSQNRLQDQQLYWHERLSGELPVLNLATDYPRPPLQSFNADKINFDIDVSLTGKLKALAKREISTIFMILTAAFKVLLYRYTQQEDNLIGTLIAGRSSHEMEKVIGYFVNILVLRDTIKGEWKFIDFLKKVRQNMVEAYDNQDYPFDKLVDELRVERNAGRSPVFDIMLAFQNYQEVHLESSLKSLKIEAIEKDYVVSKYDLYFDIIEMPDHIVIQLEFCSDLYKKETINRMVNHYQEILHEISSNPQQVIAAINMISPTEKKRLLIDFNDTRTQYPHDKTIIDFFADQVERTPGKTAILGPGCNQPITYRELREKSGQLARLLKGKGVGVDTIVGITVERSVEMMIGIYGILTAGGAYLPIDPLLPEERRKYMLKDSGTMLLLAREHPGETGDDICEVIDLDDCYSYEVDHLNLDKTTGSGNSAYVIYTSGSTGKPKGVIVEHKSVVNRLNWMQRFYPLDEKSVILQKTSISFDVSVWELFWWSMSGASLSLLKPGDESSPEAIMEAVEENNITTMHFVPSMLNVFLEYIKNDVNLKRLRSLREVFASGEALGLNHVEKFNLLLTEKNNTRLINLYGPTEATVDVSYYECSARENHRSIPIGKPIDNIKLYIMDKHLQLQALGVPGELYISGDGLARGYLNRPELTSEKFIQPQVDTGLHSLTQTPPLPHSPIYKTGDLARWLENGNIDFLGRIDHQVKIRGYRIEMGEIESRLLQHHQIKETAVTAWEDDLRGKHLCAYVVPVNTLDSPGSNHKWDQLKAYLSKELPDYMIPPYFVQLDKIPLTSSGKVDRKNLPAPEGDEVVGKKKFLAPRSKTEKKIAQVWSKALKIDKIGIHDNFFELGGHSLLIPRIFRKLDKIFPSKFQIADLFDYLTIEKMAMYIDGTGDDQEDEIIEISID